jgi:hypothetical protein
MTLMNSDYTINKSHKETILFRQHDLCHQCYQCHQW